MTTFNVVAGPISIKAIHLNDENVPTDKLQMDS